ncbi:cell division protein FtsZ [bacterium]|nr:cell division protein FtsZ [bacterium]
MAKISPDIEAFARIKVIGVGGSGKNAVNHMVRSKVKGVEFIAMNADAQDLHSSLAAKKVHIGKNLTRGLGAGMNPEIGKRAAEETKEEIQGVIKGADMVFVTAGMGGGTGTGAAPIVARAAKELGVLTVAVVTKPFFFEGAQRMKIAEHGIDELRREVDALIIVPNDRLLGIVQKETTLQNAFAICDEILKQAVEGISDLITTPGIINIDFADIRAVLENTGPALMGIGTASGEKRAEEAARLAINSPLLEISIHGARGVLFAVAGNDDLTMFEVQEAAKIITESIDKDAKVIFGAVKDEKLKKNEVRVTVIATGFPSDITKKLFVSERAEKGLNGNREKETGSNAVPTGKIYNDFNFEEGGIMKDKKEKQDMASVIKEKNPEREVIEDDDGEWAVPAFLRRSRLK